MKSGSRKYRAAVVVSPGLAAPYVMLDFAAALTSLGHDTRVIDLRIVHSLQTSDEKIQFVRDVKEQLLEFKPHFALGYDSAIIFPLPPSDPDSQKGHFFEALAIPYVSLFYDNPLFNVYVNDIQPYLHSRFFTIFIWDKFYKSEFERRFEVKTFYLPLAANPDIFRPLPPDPDFESDVTFVGSISETSDYTAARISGGWPDWLAQFAQLAVDSFFATPESGIDTIIAELENNMPPDFRDAFARFSENVQYTLFTLSVHDQINDAKRLEAVGALPGGIRIAVHGGDGWKRLKRGGVGLRGPVDYHSKTPLVYNSARINLNVTSLQLAAAVNQRVFDVPACGSFMLTDYRSSLTELFEPESEVVIYNGLTDLRDKAEYYLEHEEERVAIAARARKRVLAEHTYAHRAAAIISVLEDKKLI